jgi:tryptophan synthase alpha chain
MSLIKQAFEICKKESRPALLTFTVAGDNSEKKSLNILKSISPYVDICELGMPHNTPVADGGQIQNCSHRALKSGIKTKNIFKIVNQYKKYKFSKPIILMGYFNTIKQFGTENFINHCKKNKVDGLIVVDLPWPENKNFAKKCKKKLINFIQLVAPTTSSLRLKKIIKDSHDMVYYISMLSTTGGKLKISAKKIMENYNKIKKVNKKKNIVIGFGITDKTISSLTKADGLVVGSALCKTITDSIMGKKNPSIAAVKMVKKLKSQIM